MVSVDSLGEEGTSHQAAGTESEFAPARDHAAVEAHLESLGIPFTSLRNGYYDTSLLFHIAGAVETGEIAAPADGLVAWTSRADLAGAAAAILAGDHDFHGPTPPLTAAAAVDLEAVARLLSEHSGRAIRRVTVPDEDYVAGPALELLIGRKPQSIDVALATATS